MNEKISRRDFFKQSGKKIIPVLTLLGLNFIGSPEGIPIPYKKKIALLAMNLQNESFLNGDLEILDNQKKVIDSILNKGNSSIYLARDLSSNEFSIESSLIQEYLLNKSGVERKIVNYFDLGNERIVNSVIREIKKNRIESIVLIGKDLNGDSFQKLKVGLNKKGTLFYSSIDLGWSGGEINYLSNNYSEMLKRIFN